jgi:hypothetical protein
VRLQIYILCTPPLYYHALRCELAKYAFVARELPSRYLSFAIGKASFVGTCGGRCSLILSYVPQLYINIYKRQLIDVATTAGDAQLVKEQGARTLNVGCSALSNEWSHHTYQTISRNSTKGLRMRCILSGHNGWY